MPKGLRNDVLPTVKTFSNDFYI